MLNVLPCSATPKRAIAEAARVLRPRGRVLLTTLAQHEHASLTEQYGHVRAGDATPSLRRSFSAAGLSVEICDVTSRERQKPHFRVITAVAVKEPS